MGEEQNGTRLEWVLLSVFGIGYIGGAVSIILADWLFR